jgi:putative tryptophan/tyrosine transport system substrate-binding protein
MSHSSNDLLMFLRACRGSWHAKFLISQPDQVVSLAAQHGVPTAYFSREFTEAGGLMSYGTSIANGYRQVGNYAGQILNGAKPTDLPVVQPTNFDLPPTLRLATAWWLPDQG